MTVNQILQPTPGPVTPGPATPEPATGAIAREFPHPLHTETAAVHGGIARSPFEETAEALYLTSGYVYGSAEEAAEAFENPDLRYVYSRYGNPTVQMFVDRLCAIEGAEAGVATASGMSAVFTALIGLLRAGDRLVASRALFGSCAFVCTDILPRFGIITDLVDGTDLAAWERALATPAKAVFLETPTNPQLEIVDLAAVAKLARDAGATVVVDNVFATPLLQRPLELGADVAVYSATKHIDGQGRCLGGAILGSKEYCNEALSPFVRHTGPSMSPFNAWVLLKGLETLAVRVERQCRTAAEIAHWLERRAGVRRVLYPFLDSHPQAELARRQMADGGTVVTFMIEGTIEGGRREAFALLNALQLIPISNNLGDAKSLATHPASTTHHRIGAEGRAAVGIGDDMIRLSVGLEHPDDLIRDLDRALDCAGALAGPGA
ncbi:MAG: O-succinylhomoserine sulfhydrylase [Rhodospirillaceae bacterium]|nr:O-succinylhomoserine sulfhydrylase [Rhodospirillaceae bacterium]